MINTEQIGVQTTSHVRQYTEHAMKIGILVTSFVGYDKESMHATTI